MGYFRGKYQERANTTNYTMLQSYDKTLRTLKSHKYGHK